MRAAVFHGAGDIRVEEVTAPESPRAGEILVRPLWCGICGTDLHEYAQGPIVIPREPHPLTRACGSQILGHEFSAEVVEVGDGVTAVRPGERVSVMPLLSCGHCYFCRRGLNHLCRTMAAVGLSYQWGGIADLAIVPAANVTVLPDGVSDLQGAVVEPGAVAAYGVDTARVRPGDNVLITGAGPIGALASLYAASLGANVFVSEVNPVRAALVRSFDVGVVLDPTAVDVPGWLRDRTDGIGVDAVIECSGNERALQAAIASVRSAGRISQTGLHTKAAAIDPMVISEHDITISGTWCFPVTDWPRIIDLIDRGRYPVEKVVTAQIAMKDVVAQGFDTLLSPTGDQVKVLVRAGS
ncbi:MULTISPECIES: 2,3-butanediol dehydrogenase [unclassified Cryobacterium]|uniref:2,3-butanediol dehydrogenase n=1 Tax=unclassified Cryobacterium TaxID=2649013 RepID=UPI001068F53B|nr:MULTISPECIES: 2,3-butanediol dehydrogenase [unclassified Cryobacterium]TFB92968.1 2,3-butanediol dehydrogenase [Cryobacterium sp. MDB2-A-1]TFC05856.1 2,3-butanediol dehydrogenase [Cryobacterium sp. MDB2-33-2]TFC10608.1 2,3-butanediol dehydrogenase [Cryobacterium sp. MDB2-A-2]TFC21577.1 2,3-butanediol dehydrogenase [Cryobacterium sp. MDB2-10]